MRDMRLLVTAGVLAIVIALVAVALAGREIYLASTITDQPTLSPRETRSTILRAPPPVFHFTGGADRLSLAAPADSREGAAPPQPSLPTLGGQGAA